MPIMGVSRFERFFRAAARLDVDKNDLKRYNDFLDTKIYDLLLIGQAAANANGRDIIQPSDLPITKGLQESIHGFRKLDEDIELAPILEQLTAARPPLDAALGEEAQNRLPEIAGGLSLALARTFKIIDPTLKNPQTDHWERAFQIFGTLV
ncbi:DUF1931 family protein [Actinopolymorpha sp. B11F2]|uniref:DUF1931 family protein n=1 Tax=Actinopolymorpha sp. B11F2 TaxID=3160862 RepID=UPI0032E4069A